MTFVLIHAELLRERLTTTPLRVCDEPIRLQHMAMLTAPEALAAMLDRLAHL